MFEKQFIPSKKQQKQMNCNYPSLAQMMTSVEHEKHT